MALEYAFLYNETIYWHIPLKLSININSSFLHKYKFLHNYKLCCREHLCQYFRLFLGEIAKCISLG